MRRKRGRLRSQGEVELNMAAMLDMAFQLLAFFILTFRPSPMEADISLHLPPPVSVTNVEAAPADAPAVQPSGELRTLAIYLRADAEGRTSSVSIEARPVFEGALNAANLATFERELRDVLTAAGGGLDQVLIHVDPRLLYEHLMRIVEVCSRQKLPSGEQLTRINFVELRGQE